MTARRTAAALFLGLFLGLLASSAGHDHLRHDAATAASCVFCGAALAVGPAVPAVLRPPPAGREPAAQRPSAPVLPFLLRLDHSGGAPPMA
jgi:hypothetical protein